MPQQFSPTLLTSTSFVFLQQSEILYWENNLDKEFWELSNNKIKIVIRVELLVKESDTVTLLIFSVVFRY